MFYDKNKQLQKSDLQLIKKALEDENKLFSEIEQLGEEKRKTDELIRFQIEQLIQAKERQED